MSCLASLKEENGEITPNLFSFWCYRYNETAVEKWPHFPSYFGRYASVELRCADITGKLGTSWAQTPLASWPTLRSSRGWFQHLSLRVTTKHEAIFRHNSAWILGVLLRRNSLSPVQWAHSA